ncbi:phage tail protein [Shewanella sp. WE21]|uniref:phage tail protein n=1 Tax=Shewanella sp. WE21 TaxID=2029986 RepID=UPI000CF730C3|nr:phage tail protein [Shewanella sp. WE21]AVI66951.1 phage tail protein [Shewanella sp. WE21]
MITLTLPFWMQKGELAKLRCASQSFWEKVDLWLQLSLTKFDLLTCDLVFVDCVAWERKITRLDGEDEMIYRRRVHYAFLNAQDAGMNRGMFNIFERLGVPLQGILERQPNKDWDVVTIELSDDALSTHKNLINLLVNTYGATCRRYEYQVSTKVVQFVHVGLMQWSHQVYVSTPPPPAPAKPVIPINNILFWAYA